VLASHKIVYHVPVTAKTNLAESAANPQLIGHQSSAHKLSRAAMIRRIATSYPKITQRAIARRVGCSQQNVHKVLKRFLAHSEKDLQDFQARKADVYDSLQLRFLESVTDEKIAKMAPKDAIIGAAILEDKARLVRGQATGINIQVLLDVAAMIRREDD